ncbi:MAG TPA: LLM class flavin-dependent oxidoreductase [Solirubrobacteraceae bacterium]|nr:LLM class flavin-dependent oxidoreductase [Solirubrobacteraceae bacterium]
MAGDPIRVGIVLREQDLTAWAGRLPALADRAVAAGIDHLTVGDHVSFADGHGVDGLIQAAALLAAHSELNVHTGVYLLALRHPAVVARQLATIGQLAPGRFTFGIGVGGDDPSELELCGINPRERGARTSEALRCVRLLMTGDEVDFRGRFFNLQGAIRPAPAPAIPILVGGRSDAALARAGRLGDGWLALWVSPRRFGEAADRIEAAAGEAGRSGVAWRHALQLWAGFDETRAKARERVSTAMEAAYALPFDGFERYTPCGPPPAVAEALVPYLTLGCRCFNFVPEAASLPAAMEAASEVKALLTEARATPAARRP